MGIVSASMKINTIKYQNKYIEKKKLHTFLILNIF